MSENFTIFLIAQSLIIVGAILAAYVRTAVAVARVQINTELLKEDHGDLSKKVDGISRAVSRL